MRVILAPMEGVLDHPMRELLTSINNYDLCVTEFVRVVDQLLPARVFHRICPELSQGGKTRSGTPVRIQILGQSPQWMAENAHRAVSLGSPGVDINFGCPAATVNRSKGGAVLLKEPETIYKIVKAVRTAVPASEPVTVKIRLGFDDKTLYLENAQAIYEAGASELAVHARTRREGYKPPAHWQYIADIRTKITIPVIANGEIWNNDDACRCKSLSLCNDVMVGRSALSTPNMSHVVKTNEQPMNWPLVIQLLQRYADQEQNGEKWRYFPGRTKQWLKYLQLQYAEAATLFQKVKSIKTPDDMAEALRAIYTPHK